ncbi:DUF982 domain-containing protein [Maritimibacter alkaliphilus]|uniref:DUF982 domain-containing protein n=1 Tax=Maritimibacter alkaliphilus TaxID=404236 RepID=UPI001C952F82|nr:DUF982 domain-containing protein [Maritimibacter alkaliphilus]MBY6089773.1 DUF982 domain-containing protein [Maritimibacter alkaliphilus]
MIEIQWGEPVALRQPHSGDIDWFSTIEKARYWLRRRWPVADNAQERALEKIDSAMDCTGPVEDARSAFLLAAISAGFTPDRASRAACDIHNDGWPA